MRRKILLFGAGCFGLLLILLVAFFLLLPYLINLEPISEKIEALLPEIDSLIERANCGVMITIERVDVRKYAAGK